MTYMPGQVKNIFPWVPKNVEWFLLGGPADGDEAQVFKEAYPRVKCVGLEPNMTGYQYQLPTFPGTLLNAALWDSDTRLSEQLQSFGDPVDRGRCAIMVEDECGRVAGRSLDSLSADHGPFTDAVLWLDIEGSERRAIDGAAELLRSGSVKLINLETHCDGDTEERHVPSPIADVMRSFGFSEVHRWNGQRYPAGCRYDVVFKLNT